MAVCISCGKEIAEGAKFCINCGAPRPVENNPAGEVDKESSGLVMGTTELLPSTEPPAAPAIETEFIPKPLFTERDNRVTSAYDDIVIPKPAAEQPKPSVEFTPAETVEKPGKKSKWDIITTKGYIGINLLLAIPGVGLILAIIWACGGCRKYAKRNYARAALIFMAIGVLLFVAGALVVRFAFPELIVQAFEIVCPGYTIIF